MTKAEAIEAMKRGEKVTHRYFTSEEWVTEKNGRIVFEDGCSYTPHEFWLFRTEIAFESDWSLWAGAEATGKSDRSDNELIAEFMGAEFQKEKNWHRDHWGSMPFHTSWDWLMPVWIKFRSLDRKQFIENASVETYDEWVGSLQWYLFSSDEPGRFCERLAYAIKWFNSNKKA